MTATPRPWKVSTTQVDTLPHGSGDLEIWAEGTPVIAKIPIRHVSINEQKANAALIVKAVNTHERAKAVLQLAFDCGYSNALAAGQTDAYVKNEPWYKSIKALLTDMEG